ncbi:MAG: hypothetical protein P4N41_08525, partial [Negativicutes bacterium]|nr:hypothetical protein [Negativicutes bacterium]
PLPSSAGAAWGLPDSLVVSGDGNTFRPVQGASLGADAALELAAGGKGGLEYFREISASLPSRFAFRLHFLSTQGTGRVRLTALGVDNHAIATLGWVITGPLPAEGGPAKWLDLRSAYNFDGTWLAMSGDPAEMFARQLPGSSLAGVAKYRLSVDVGQGQHALVTTCELAGLPARALKITPQTDAFSLTLGESISLQVAVENSGSETLAAAKVEMLEPFGYGLIAQDERIRVIDHLAPGEKRILSWQVKAQRPDAVNLDRPWTVGFAVDGVAAAAKVTVAVADPRPGKIFYVMTEDLEPIDSAGYPSAWGNADGWLQPQELQVQMVAKAEAVNAIAEKYGAKWTHYIAWPVVKAAEWAAGQSTSGQWPQTVAAIKQSVREQSARGHEYAVHLHSDYDPYLPGNVLSYNPATDGLWANHLRHGWAHSVGTEGAGFGDYTSRTGMLYAYQRILDELTGASPNGQLVTSRAGSFDFGGGPADEAMSTRVYRKVGLLGGSDADGNKGGITAGEFGREIYLARPDDIGIPAGELDRVGLVEFRPTPRDCIDYSTQSADEMNRRADQGMAAFAPQGLVKPGVHAVVGFTHVMFMLGTGDWQSVLGGQFAQLDGHLLYLQQQYAARGLLTFGTASDLVKAYLDYYSPQPVAVYGPRSSDGWAAAEYPVVILGRDIPVDPGHPHTVTVKYPLYFRDSAYRISVLKDGRPIYSTWGLPTPYNDINFVFDDPQAHYSLKIYHNEYIYRFMSVVRALKAKISGLG